MKRARALIITGTLTLLVGCGYSDNGSNSSRTRITSPPAPCLTCGTTTTGIATNSGNEEHPPPSDVALGECISHGQLGPSATGTLTNPTSELSNYMISVNFTDEAGVIVASALGMANNIPSGATANWQAESFDMNVTAASCAVVKVDRYSAQ